MLYAEPVFGSQPKPLNSSLTNKILHRISLYPGFKDGKVTEFLLQNFSQEVGSKLLTFIVANVSDKHAAIGIKKFVVLHVSGYI